jgi:hypothetical protein
MQLREDQRRALEEMASARGVSIAELVRQSVDALIRSWKGRNEEEVRQRAIAAAGRFRSGRSRVSAQHDRHLAEAFRR